MRHVCFNRDGDLLLSCDRDGTACVWWADTGERLGTFETDTGGEDKQKAALNYIDISGTRLLGVL